jgi:hypothetical protein
MKRLLASILCATFSAMAFAATDSGYKVMYDGGSVPDTKVGVGLKLLQGDKYIPKLPGRLKGSC